MVSTDKLSNHPLIKQDEGETATADVVLPNGNYSVKVYDYIQPESSINPAITTSFIVSFPSTSTTSTQTTTTGSSTSTSISPTTSPTTSPVSSPTTSPTISPTGSNDHETTVLKSLLGVAVVIIVILVIIILVIVIGYCSRKKKYCTRLYTFITS